MKKNSLTGRTICTRSVTATTLSPAAIEPGLRRSHRETPSKNPITPASSTRKSERLASSPASQRSDKGKNVLSQNTKGSDKSGRNADTSLESNQRKVKRKTNIEESTNKIKKREPIMSARSYRALFRGKLNLPKRVRYFPESDEIDNVGNRKKLKKAFDDVTDHPVTDSQVDNDERRASGKDHIGALESPKVAVALPSLGRSATATNGTLIGNDAFGLYSTGSHISGIPEDMLGRQIPCESQRSLHAVLKSEMAKLGKVLDFSENWTSMVEKFLEYVIENHRVCEKPATTLQAFQIALSWIAASLVKHKFKREDSLVQAKSELAFNCSREEVEYIYSMLYCMKSLFLESAQGLQLDCFGTNSKQSLVSTKQVNESISEAEECLTEKRGSHYSTATKDIKKTISDIKEKYKKKEQKLVQAHEEKMVELVNRFADKKRELETRKKLKAEVIHTSTQSLGDDLKRLDRDYERESDEITRENDECLKSLDQMHKAAKKKLAEDEACWISRIKKWAQVEFKKYVPIKSANNKHCSGICSPSTSKSADVQTCNDVNGEATCADMNCMLSKGNQVAEAENTLGTMRGGSYEMVASTEEKAMDISCLSREQPADNVATKSQSSEHATITVPEIVFPASCQEEFAALNVHLSEHQTSDTMTSAGPDEDVSSKLSEISQSFANLAKCASPASSLNREEILVTIENDTTSHVDSDADTILDQQNEEACSLDKEIRDELVVETSGSAEFGQDDPHICPMPSSPAEKQPDPASNTQGENIEAAIEPQTTRSETVETGDLVTLEEGGQVTCPLPSSPPGNQPDPAAIILGQNTSAEPRIVGPDAGEISDSAVSDQETMGPQDACSLPPASVGTQSDLAANVEGQNTRTVAQLHTAGSNAVVDQGAQNASPLQFSSPGNDPDAAGNIEGLINTTVTGPHTTGSDASSLPFSSPQNHPDAAVNTEAVNNTTMTEPHTSGSDACEMEIADTGPHVEQSTFANNLVDEGDVEPSAGVTTHVPLPYSSRENHPDAAVNTEGISNTTMTEPHTSGLDACEMEIADTGPHVEQSTFADNLVDDGGVEPSAGVTTHVPSLLNNGTVQSTVQPIPQIPFPVFNDPFQYELEKFRRETENMQKTYEEKKSILKAELGRKMAEVQAEYQRKFNEVEAEHKAIAMENNKNKSFVLMNKVLANTFLSKCTTDLSHPSAISRGRIQQLAQRAAQVSALRNNSAHARARAPLQPQASSFPCPVPRPSSLSLHSALCPMPQPRQPLIFNSVPSPSASLATNPVVNARLGSPVPHLNTYRSSTAVPTATASPTALQLPRALVYSPVLVQQQQQEQ